MWFQALEFSVSCTIAMYFFLLQNEKEERTRYDFWVPPALVLQQKKILDYRTRNRKFKRLEPHFQPSATRSASKEDTKRAVALTHSRGCTKELISGLPNFGSLETFGAREKNEMSSGKKRRQTCFHWLCCRNFFLCLVGSATQVNTIPPYKPFKEQGHDSITVYTPGTSTHSYQLLHTTGITPEVQLLILGVSCSNGSTRET